MILYWEVREDCKDPPPPEGAIQKEQAGEGFKDRSVLGTFQSRAWPY